MPRAECDAFRYAQLLIAARADPEDSVDKVLVLQEGKRKLISSVMDPESEVTSALDAMQFRELIAG